MASIEWWTICLGVLCTGIVAQNSVVNYYEKEICTTSSGEQGTCVYQYQCTDGVITSSGENVIDIRQPGDGCIDYLMECCVERSEPSTNVPTVNVPPYTIEGCGHRNPHGVIFTIENNQLSETEYGEYPWTVAIFVREKNNSLKYLCGGALIDQAAVLTTATCLHPYRFNVPSLVVRLGEWDMSTNREPIPHIDSEMEKIFLHPEYSMTSKINDIAIIILRDTIELNHTVGVVCLPPASSNPGGAEVVGVGWGDVPNFVEPRKLRQTILKKTHLRHVLHDLCEKALRNLMDRRYQLDRSFICAEAQHTEMLPCRGDTGSPYMMEIAHGIDRYYLVGLSSWGFDCNRQNAPTVLTNVAYHRDWIDAVIKQENLNIWSYTYAEPISSDEE